MQRFRLLWMISLTAALAALMVTGCDLLDGDENINQEPVVSFVNVPLDSTVFNYAPIVHWTGHDPDGFVSGYEYYDDASDEGIAAFEEGDAALLTYIAGLDPSVWVSTDETSATVFLLSEEDGGRKPHIFFVRCFDDKDTYSPVKFRTFFRENNPPNPPRVRWALDPTRCDNPTGFDTVYTICDTVFWGEELTVTYPGVQFLWIGSDPDSRLTNIIPLEYSYMLVNTTTGDTAALPVLNDSLQVVGSRRGWTDWTAATQVTLFGYETGNHEFSLRIRDDGLTVSDVTARAEFYAIKPDRDKLLLVVDANNEPRMIDLLLGGRDSDDIMAYYDDPIEGLLSKAYEAAEILRNNPFVIREDSVREAIGAFDDFANDVVVYQNREDDPLPYDLIHQFEVVWWIDDDNALGSGLSDDLEEVLEDYMNVGGHVMLSGRSVLAGPFRLPQGTPIPSRFFMDYFGLASVHSKPRSNNTAVARAEADFGCATTGSSGLLEICVDTTISHQIGWGPPSNAFRPDCLPEIEWFGRNLMQTGLDFGSTILNYFSCTVDDTNRADDVDFDVEDSLSTPAIAVLETEEYLRITDVIRVYNVSKGVFGEFLYVDPNSSTGGVPDPLIYVSTPASEGQWTDSDTLEVDYIFIPTSIDHGQPVGGRFGRMDGTISVTFNADGSTIIRVVARNRFKTSLYTIPLSFMDNSEVEPPSWALDLGPVGPVTLLIATELLWFKIPVDFEFGQDF